MMKIPVIVMAAVLFLAPMCDAFGGTNSWTSISPPDRKLEAVDPTNISTLFISGRTGSTSGVWKTTDGGATWVQKLFNAPEIMAVAIDPLTPSTVYVAVRGMTNFGGALYKSTNGGDTWAVKNLGLQGEVVGLAIDPITPATVYASTFESGIYRTTNGGDLWTQVSNRGGNIEIDPVNSGNVYATVASGILKSTDSGTTWNEIRVWPLGGDVFIRSLKLDRAAPSNLFLVGWLPGGVFRSTDGGSSWSRVAASMLNDPGLELGSIRNLAITPSPGRVLFAASEIQQGAGIFRSLDDGATWTDANAGFPAVFSDPPTYGYPSNLANSPASANTLFASAYRGPASGGGVYRYTHDASLLTPTCSLSATPPVVAEGATTTLATLCSPVASSFDWSPNTGLSPSASGGTVSPTQTSTYTVRGMNANGSGNLASVTVKTPSPRFVNISTRGQVLTGNEVMIGGFVLDTTKTVVVRARGPSLAASGVANVLANPTLQLVRSSDQTTIATNDNWQSASNSSQIQASGFAPTDPLESAILVTLPPGAYTGIVFGFGGGSGIGIVEVFELDHPESPLVNISTRGQVATGENVLIGGFVIQGNGPQTVVVRARGPSLVPFGIPNALADPVLQLFSGQTQIASNDDWANAPNAAQVQSSGMAPSNSKESAILITLNPGAYTAIVSGAGGGTGVGIVEVFAQ